MMGAPDGRELKDDGVSAGRTLANIEAVVSRRRRLAFKTVAVCVRRRYTRELVE